MQSSDEPALRVTMMPRDTNPHGTIFGGVILSYIDQAAAVEALTGPQDFVREMVERISATGHRQDLIDLSNRHSLDVVCGYLKEPGKFGVAKESWNWDSMRSISVPPWSAP